MFSKLSKSLVLAFLLSIAMTGAASAAQGEGPGSGKARGELTAIDVENDSFTLQQRDGETVEVRVAADAVFLSRDGSVAGIDDLETGMLVLVRGEAQDDGTILAHFVGAAKPGERPAGRRMRGEVTALDAQAGTLNVATARGEAIEVLVNEATQYRSPDGSVEGLGDIEVGMHVGMFVQSQEDDSLLALAVVGGLPDNPGRDRHGRRLGGQISGVDAGGDTFTVETRRGESVDVQVTDDTVFYSREGEISGIQDLEVGMLVGVRAEAQDDGSLVALTVVAGKPGQRAGGGPAASAVGQGQAAASNSESAS